MAFRGEGREDFNVLLSFRVVHTVDSTEISKCDGDVWNGSFETLNDA